jgi:MoxR-like ATPase
VHELAFEDTATDEPLLGGWKELADVLSAGIDRIILHGPPGTGKTYAALRYGVGAAGAERLICTEDVTSAEVTGNWIPMGGDRWEWNEGPAIRAWRHGSRLVVDEVDRAAGDVLSLLLAMTDTDGSTQWRQPATGEVLRPHRNFSVVMTTNLDRLDELPSALRDRFPVAIRIDRPHPSSVRGLSPDVRRAALAGSLGDPDRRLSLRTFYAFDQLRRSLGAERSAELLLGAERGRALLDALTISALRP